MAHARQTADGHQSRVAGALMSEQWGAVAEAQRVGDRYPTLETTRKQIHGFFGQLSFKCYLLEVGSVGDGLEIGPWVACRVALFTYRLSVVLPRYPCMPRRQVEQRLRSNVKQFQGGLVFKAHRLLYHSTLGRE